jgi:hypothetical protein
LIVCFGYFIGYCKIKICPKPFQPKTGLVKLTSKLKDGNELVKGEFTRPTFCRATKTTSRVFVVAGRVARWYIFPTKVPNLGKFWRALERKMLVLFMAVWNVLRPSVIFYGRLV